MTEKDMEQLLQELLEECDNEKFVDGVSTFKDDKWAGNEKTKKHGLIITTPDGSWFFVTIEKVI